MDTEYLKQKPLWQMTGEEFLSLQNHRESESETQDELNSTTKQFVYGLKGLANLFGCSIPTASRIKASGKIDRAITQIGRKIIVDADLAIELAGRKNGGRK